MSARSMTGYARVKQTFPGGEIVCSIKAVNNRALDLHFHMPPEMDPLEADLRGIVKKGVARGHIQVQISLTPAGGTEAAGGAGAVNRELMDAYVRGFYEASEIHGLKGQPDINSALRVPGMLMSAGSEELGEDAAAAVRGAVADAVDALNQFREREGGAIAAEIRERCKNVVALAARMEQIREGAVPAFQQRLQERLAELLRGAGLEPQRLAQEAAVLADRSDVTEELVRLRTHAAQLEKILDSTEAGKRLDFLLQEMNREANTTLSKTGGLGELGLTMTDLGLAAKAEIDKIREQALNLE